MCLEFLHLIPEKVEDLNVGKHNGETYNRTLYILMEIPRHNLTHTGSMIDTNVANHTFKEPTELKLKTNAFNWTAMFQQLL